jgi:hypothetical protein
LGVEVNGTEKSIPGVLGDGIVMDVGAWVMSPRVNIHILVNIQESNTDYQK